MEEKIISSPMAFQNFISSSIYIDFCYELDIRINGLTKLLHDENLEYTGRNYDMFRGGIKNMFEMKDIFTDLMENKINDLDHEGDR